MPRPRRFYEAGRPYYATARLRRGLPMVQNELMNSIISGILANALQDHPIKLCHFVFMSNHFHLLFVCLDAKQATYFFKYLKGEIARTINKLTKSAGPLWSSSRTDSPVVLTEAKCIEKIVYTYANPAVANLVESISDYPGLSSWDMFMNNEYSRQCKRYYVRELNHLNKNDMGISAQKLFEALNTGKKNQDRVENTLTIEPYAWLGCSEDSLTEVEAREIIIELLKEWELEAANKRKDDSKTVIGSNNLQLKCIYVSYYPKNYGKRSISIGGDGEAQKAYRVSYKAKSEEGYSVYLKWEKGNTKERMPLGMLSPPFPLLSNAVHL